MPFGLKNVRVTYQRLVNRIFKEKIGDTMEVYIHDMVVKSKEKKDNTVHPQESFDVLRKYNIKLNPKKCTFGVASGKFLGCLVTKHGIEANPNQIKAIMETSSLRTTKEIHSLTERAVVISHFLSCSTDKCKPFFITIKKSKGLLSTDKCEEAFTKLKEYLSKSPLMYKSIDGEDLYLYLVVSDCTVNATLIQEDLGEQKPVYYVSKVILALVTTTRKFRP